LSEQPVGSIQSKAANTRPYYVFASQFPQGRDFPPEKLIAETPTCRAYLQVSRFPIRTIGYVSDGI
ncbi:MAG TPA: hypothetical protein VM260_05970, partial [Pirellula sp.]|nr:hypothetical protein [Pirellula sp.]